jgi:hypothetical protein
MDALKEIKEKNLYTKEPAPDMPDWLLARKAYHGDVLDRLMAMGLPREVHRHVLRQVPDKVGIQPGKWPNELLEEVAAQVMPYSVEGFSASKKRRWTWAFDYWFDIWLYNERDKGRRSLKIADALMEVKNKKLFGAKEVGELAHIMPLGL